ncbi:type II toxin-antitoxin system PemK/MazF family toxin [Sphingoaurantiacus capsulatus]|uniref:Type II toxin-antitoxin system PemK/MazF family toxin n=1 Tax=Sphingoaurantiacus capsulatus TaxID=1771310 RepID=A0ABV7X6F2_9SPHN
MRTLTARATPIFERGDIVRLPFPYTDRPVQQRRPALIVSDGGVGAGGRLIWVVMITSAANAPWPQDVAIGDDYSKLGLPIPSVVRPTKVAALDGGSAELIGKASDDLLARVLQEIGDILNVR